MSGIVQNRNARIILWTARIWGTSALAFGLFFLLAHLFGNEESGEGLRNLKEVVTFICFPIATLTGFAVALKWEGLGGLITSLALITGMLLNEAMDLKFILIFLLPALLYILYWKVEKISLRSKVTFSR
jgi:hypothetical protein